MRAGNRLQLAPLYDLLCTSIYPQLDTRMAMAIGGEYRPEWVQHRHWQRFAAEASINFSLLQKRGLALAGKVLAGIQLVMVALGVEDNTVLGSIAELIHKRVRWLESRLFGECMKQREGMSNPGKQQIQRCHDFLSFVRR